MLIFVPYPSKAHVHKHAGGTDSATQGETERLEDQLYDLDSCLFRETLPGKVLETELTIHSVTISTSGLYAKKRGRTLILNITEPTKSQVSPDVVALIRSLESSTLRRRA